MFITKKHLSRRTFLRGAGVTMALPLLDAMRPSFLYAKPGLNAAQPGAARRMIAIPTMFPSGSTSQMVFLHLGHCASFGNCVPFTFTRNSPQSSHVIGIEKFTP